MTSEEDGDLESLLEYLKDSRGFDFTGYKRASLARRIGRRMQVLGVESFTAYRDFLEAQPEEFGSLFDTILINVTSFFRDRELWDYVATTVIPRLLEAKGDRAPIRLWSAGCASGEETYSLAILLCDAVGEERFRSHVKIYGTDADNDALTTARHARYPKRAVEGIVAPDQVERYFEPNDDDFIFRTDLRRSVIFGRHDLVADPPISRVDLLSCRNTLMYFNAETQRRVLGNFHFALAPGGYLLLGKSEALVTRTNLFRIEDLKRHVFQRDGERPTRPPAPAPLRTPSSSGDRFVHASFDSSPIAQLIVAADGRLVFANRQARTQFGIGLTQVGHPLKDLEVSYRPVELRSRLNEVLSGRRPVTIPEVEHTVPGGGTEYFDIQLLPLGTDGGSPVGISVVFTPTTRFRHLRDEAERFQRELETTYEELQSTNEELETTNEELQSTNEELETTNEELHSTNEELETMNEELQSTNEELETMNDELRERTLELDSLSSFLQIILGSLSCAVVVLNQNMEVQTWNRPAEEMWGLRADEVDGAHFTNLDIGISVDALRPAIRGALSSKSEIEQFELDAVDRRGRSFRCLVTIKPLQSGGGRPGGGRPDGVIVMMDRRTT